MAQRRTKLWTFGKVSKRWEVVGLYFPDEAHRHMAREQEDNPLGHYAVSARKPKRAPVRDIHLKAPDYTKMDAIDFWAYFCDERQDFLVFVAETEEVLPLSEAQVEAAKGYTAYMVDPYTMEVTSYEAW